MRTEKEIKEERGRLFKIVWWNRHKAVEEKTELENYTPEQKEVSMKKAKEIEKEISQKELMLSGAGWYITQGKYSAINWVLGADWTASMDT